MTQMFEQMFTTGCRRAYFVSLFVPKTLNQRAQMRVWRVQWNDAYWNEVMRRLRDVLDALRCMDVDRKFEWNNKPMPAVEAVEDETFNLNFEDVCWACSVAQVPLPFDL
jgi:hypothetical protein